MQRFEVFKWIDLAKIAGMNQAHEQITDVGPMLGFIEQRILVDAPGVGPREEFDITSDTIKLAFEKGSKLTFSKAKRAFF